MIVVLIAEMSCVLLRTSMNAGDARIVTMNNTQYFDEPLVQVFQRRANVQLSKNFNSNEFDDDYNHEGNFYTLISPGLTVMLQELRNVLGPIHITSGFRTWWKNDLIGGAKQSKHKLGLAADWTTNIVIDLAYQRILDLISEGELPYIGGLGYYPEKNFIHTDVRIRNQGRVRVWIKRINNNYITETEKLWIDYGQNAKYNLYRV